MRPEEAALAFFVFGGGFWVLRPLVGALARRVAGEAGRVPNPDELAVLRAELLDGLGQIRQEMGELAERVDFAERLLAKRPEGERLVPPR